MSRMTITPAMAETWLGRNTRNRHIRPVTVQIYARDMAEGSWQYTGESIKFDTEGRLLDGQHRLRAIIEANVPVDMEVIEDLNPDAQDVLDTGLKRTFADMLRMSEVPYATTVAAAARIGLAVERGVIHGHKFSPTHTEVLEWVEQHPAIIRSSEIGRSNLSRHACIRPAILAYCHFEMAKIDEDAAGLFWEGVAEKVGLEAGDARLALALRLADIQRNRSRLATAQFLSMIFRSWNHWREGRSVSLIRTTQNGVAPQIPELV